MGKFFLIIIAISVAILLAMSAYVISPGPEVGGGTGGGSLRTAPPRRGGDHGGEGGDGDDQTERHHPSMVGCRRL